MGVTISAPGKINLFFSVGGLRPDGFHEVVSVYHALNLREQVSVERATDTTLTVTGITEGVPLDESNLALRAARLITDEPISVTIHKEVPVAGGMGGGSADAAAALVAVSTLFETHLDQSLAASLGSDVPFAVYGGTMLGTSRGEKLEPLACKQELHWVLVPAKFGLSTPVVYRTLDQLRPQAGLANPEELVKALAEGDLAGIAKNMRNDLEQAALHLAPELQKTIDAVTTAGALRAMVSGSGPTVLALARDAADAKRIAAEVGGIATSGPAEGAI
jgi:4-diphosphocytidyl-2-C-methyl-D-erythritol kinase